MKKHLGAKIAAVCLAAAMTVSFAGCGGDTSDLKSIDAGAVIQQVRENMEYVENASITMDVNIDMTNTMVEENNRMQMNASIDMDLKQEPFQMYMGAGMNVDVPGSTSENMQAEVYIVPDGKNYVGYMGEGEDAKTMTWKKQSISASDVAELKEQLQAQTNNTEMQEAQKQLYALLGDSVTLEATGREKVNNVNALVISGELRFADLLKALEKSGADELMGDLTDLPAEMQDIYKSITVPFQFYIDEENQTLVKCSFDLKTTFEEIFRQAVTSYLPTTSEPMDEELLDSLIPIEIHAAEISVTINAVGDAVEDIQVPQNVVKEAVEMEKGESVSLPLFGDPLTDV